jgi:hypothetical protein
MNQDSSLPPKHDYTRPTQNGKTVRGPEVIYNFSKRIINDNGNTHHGLGGIRLSASLFKKPQAL